jgi:hypothetical protein
MDNTNRPHKLREHAVRKRNAMLRDMGIRAGSRVRTRVPAIKETVVMEVLSDGMILVADHEEPISATNSARNLDDDD